MQICQIIDLVNMDNSRLLRAWRLVEMRGAPVLAEVDRRLPRPWVRRRRKAVRRAKSWLGKVVKPAPGPLPPRETGAASGAGAPAEAQARFRPGDLVRVKSFEAVQRTLDRRGMCGGLRFMPVQQHYCGQAFRVLKQVNTFLDERDFRVKHLREVVILEGVYCDGSPLEPVPCDRMCFLFWKEAWLEKTDSGG